MPASQPTRQKIAILGGGLGSLSTAFALTNQRGWQDRYEITVYQMGWRLGGKGASGRNLDPDYRSRIEEHGFHVWMGFYDNAFKMIKQCYKELVRTTGPFRTWTDAFKKHSLVVIEEQHEGKRKRWRIDFPTGPREPGTYVQLGLFGYAARMFRLLQRRVPTSISKKRHGAPALRVGQKLWRSVFIGVLSILALAEFFLRLLESRVDGRLQSLRGPRARAAVGQLRRLLGALSRAARRGVEGISKALIAWAAAADVADDLDEGRRLRVFFDLSLAVLRGILVDDIIKKGFGSIDHLEFKEWLLRHNAAPETVDSAIIDSIYDGNFSFTKGDRSKPNFAAGVALHCYLRIFLDYKGGFLYKMQAGMGDVVIAPLYLALRKRGVRFRFFHKVEELIFDAQTKQISAIDMTEQVVPIGEYAPLVDVEVEGGQIPCWPSAPRYEFFQDGAELAASGINLESQWAKPWKGSMKKRLTQGKDYDLIVLGISIGALSGICRQLIEALPAWRLMIEKVDTVATQAMQLWLSPDVPSLGWDLPSPLVVNYAEPAANWLDSSQVIPHEPLPGKRAGSVAYFCSVLQDVDAIPLAGPNSFPEDQRRAVQETHQGWIAKEACYLWPHLAAPAGRAAGVKWNMLHDPKEREGEARLEWQYFRANVEPSDRFVLSSVGATQFRLRTDQSGADNLFLTGDWTWNGFNGGCVEGTVMSGLLCSRAIAGYPHYIFGERPFGMFNL